MTRQELIKIQQKNYKNQWEKNKLIADPLYRIKRRESKKKRNKNYRLNHPKKIKLIKRNWYQKNRESILKKLRQDRLLKKSSI